MDNLRTRKNVIFVGDYFSMITTVSVAEEDVQRGETYEDACLRVAKLLMKNHYGWDLESVSNHIGIFDEGDPNCETCYGAGKVQSEVGGTLRELECPDCFNS